eukprot:gnl/TRDRNA2_/TRDRNA2_27433_c0_seq1.p1 gnl/TRDRNA2_/TRDRNA2_27433_c0~~gnl/TRDRNA2_/TRDRNA2_27433_c0_seq1.p1  ORF type:complete len:227 (-),score=21.80 gnl/TRDRNA2_/TRDRNA2_27433_c0_seq1:5-685(-)
MPGRGPVSPLVRDGTSRRVIWMGNEFVDEDTGYYVRKVVIAAAVMAGLQAAAVLIGLLHSRMGPHAWSSAFLNLIIGLILPACGYYGATKSSSQMMCCFCGGNAVIAVIQSFLLIVMMLEVHSAESIIQASCAASCQNLGCGTASTVGHDAPCSCTADCMSSQSVICCNDFMEVCPPPGWEQVNHVSCKDLQGSMGWAMTLISLVLILLIGPGIFLSAYGWWHCAR